MEEINTIDEFDKAVQLKKLTNKKINIEVSLPYVAVANRKFEYFTRSIEFENCIFSQKLKINNVIRISNENGEWISELVFKECQFQDIVDAENSNLDAKIKFLKCQFKNVANFRNTTFNLLADFWQSTFYKPTTFYKTDFNATTVFSSVTFMENVLFTYSLFDGKSIFGRTNFVKGLDISQSIIAGELQIFDLNFEFKNYLAEYVGFDNKKFQDYIDNQHKVPLINKITTFQILKSQYIKQGNHIDEITMRQQEKRAFSELTQARKTDDNWTKHTGGDRFILWLNRWSNHYKSDFRNGISFTFIVAIVFLLLTFITTNEFWNRLCLSCDLDGKVIGYIIKSFINFLNPVHKITYIDELKPFYGLPYIFDFLGRIAVGFGIYQTIQAFRKFK